MKKAIEQLFRFMQDLPLYREHFLTMICTTVMQYKVGFTFLTKYLETAILK